MNPLQRESSTSIAQHKGMLLDSQDIPPFALGEIHRTFTDKLFLARMMLITRQGMISTSSLPIFHFVCKGEKK
jgi:hypothetical protein